MARFSPDRFTVYASQRQVIERLRLHAGPGADLRVFAVTDDPVLYVMTGQPAVWVSNMYNTSPTYEQERMVRWLREDKPPYAVLDPDHLIWDGFHQAVRVPVVYSEVVHSYVPLDVVGRIHVARRRRSDEKPAIPYWRERLGADVDVGRLASVSSFRAGTTACSQVCGDLLEIEVPFGGTGRVTVSFVVADLPFSLTFTRVPSESTYRVLLDRVWFWNVAKRDGMPRSVAHALPAGVNVRVHSVPMKAGVLY
jgi:hypothetical protein